MKSVAKNNGIFKTSKLTLGELEFLPQISRVEGSNLIVWRNFGNYSLKSGGVKVPIKDVLEVGNAALVEYIFRSLIPQMPKLLPWALSDKSVVKLADYLLRFKSGSPATFYLYASLIQYFSKWSGNPPSRIIADAVNGGTTNFKKLQEHQKNLIEYVAHLQDRKLAPNRVNNYVKAVKALYKTAGIKLELPYSLPRRAVSQYRAPTPAELEKVMEVANLREKVIASALALGGFREGTLCRLKYRHVRSDLEAGVVPIHIHVEASETKGKYGAFDTFLGAECASWLKMYIDARRRGTGKKKQERHRHSTPRGNHRRLPAYSERRTRKSQADKRKTDIQNNS